LPPTRRRSRVVASDTSKEPRRAIAGEWAAKLYLVADAFRDKRTDTALVRVMAWSAGGTDEAATTVASGFARELYPRLREYLPR